jgi:hypothetical protein
MIWPNRRKKNRFLKRGEKFIKRSNKGMGIGESIIFARKIIYYFYNFILLF